MTIIQKMEKRYALCHEIIEIEASFYRVCLYKEYWCKKCDQIFLSSDEFRSNIHNLFTLQTL